MSSKPASPQSATSQKKVVVVSPADQPYAIIWLNGREIRLFGEGDDHDIVDCT